MNNQIKLKKINQNNFIDVSIDIEKNEFIVITGPSGSGKSTLAMDIIYAEGQRKFIESLPPYARQFIPLPDKPDIEETVGLTPCIAIDQKSSSCSNRSIVGTISEIYDYVRVLYALIGEQNCFKCNNKIKKLTNQEIADKIIKDHNDEYVGIIYLISIEQERTESKRDYLLRKVNGIKDLIISGFTQYIINDVRFSLRSEACIEKIKLKYEDSIYIIFYEQIGNHQKNILIGMLKIVKEKTPNQSLIRMIINYKNVIFPLQNICNICDDRVLYPDIHQKSFSFNLPTGACSMCKGIGETESYKDDIFTIFAEAANRIFDIKNVIEIDKSCSACKGARLNKISLSIKVNNKNIVEFCKIPLDEYSEHIEKIKKAYVSKKNILDKIFLQIEKRINLLVDLGIGYLTLWRGSHTLSGGELQRIRLAGQLGSALAGVTYILDEPSIGLHQSDNTKLILTIRKLRDLGNTILVVEHDDETMLAADCIIDVGPGAGVNGGKIIFHGKPKDILKDKNSITGKYLSGELSLERKKELKKGRTIFTIVNAKKNNLKNITVDIPIGGVLVAITGVSGSGKSTLIFDEFIPQCKQYLYEVCKNYKSESNIKEAQKIREARLFYDLIVIDQQALGQSNRSTVGTYFGFFDDIRDLFALLPESKLQALNKGCFSFNIGKYRCHNCSGKGYLEIAMEPLPSTIMHCVECDGKRYSQSILDITYNEKNIFDVLNMNITEAAEFFKLHKKIHKPLKALEAVGLGYITLNQSADTFSGGEAQRVKLAYELNRRGNNTVYVLDEPTTGLHFQDIALLLKIFDQLIEKGNTLIIIEHNLSIIRYADYVIDIGPCGGNKGGYVVATGTPLEIKNNIKSLTGRYI